MSFRSERGVRNIIAVATGISLFGVGSALIDYSASHDVLFVGNGSTDISRVSSTETAQQPGSLKGTASHLFSAGKQDRADTASDLATQGEQGRMLTATLTPIDLFDEPPAETEPVELQEVNRATKGDRLSAPRMSVAKFIPPVDTRETADVFRTMPPLADAQLEQDTTPAAVAKPLASKASAPVAAPASAKVASAQTAPADADASGPEMMNGPALKPVRQMAAKPAEITRNTQPVKAPEPVKVASAAPAPAPAVSPKAEEKAEITEKVEVVGSTTAQNVAAIATENALSPADKAQANKSAWDELVQLASVKGGDGEEAPTIFGGLSEKEFKARELRCMATAVYFEARDEPLRGQIAVAQVVMNRVRSEYYPMTICGVVYQNQWNRNACQFSFACDGVPDVPKEKKEWATSLDVARQVISGKIYLTDIADATHYHATYVHPQWTKMVKKVKQIGGHIFYKASFAPPLVANAEYDGL